MNIVSDFQEHSPYKDITSQYQNHVLAASLPLQKHIAIALSAELRQRLYQGLRSAAEVVAVHVILKEHHESVILGRWKKPTRSQNWIAKQVDATKSTLEDVQESNLTAFSTI